MKENRVGRVTIPSVLSPELKAVLDAAGFNIVRKQDQWDGSDCVEALVECPKFRPVANGECVPEYKVNILSFRDATLGDLIHKVTVEEQPWIRTDACVACTRKSTVTIEAKH